MPKSTAVLHRKVLQQQDPTLVQTAGQLTDNQQHMFPHANNMTSLAKASV